MSDSLYSTQDLYQFRGPTTSRDYNERVEFLYQDLVNLANQIGLTNDQSRQMVGRLIKEHHSLAMMLQELEQRVETLEADTNTKLHFYDTSLVDIDRFNGTDYEVSSVDRCTVKTKYGLMTLPIVESSSASKVRFTNANGDYSIPASFDAVTRRVYGTADSGSAVVRTSDIFNAVYPEVGRIWERNVLATAPSDNGAEVEVFIRVPLDAAISSQSNVLMLDPYPIVGVDIKEVAWTSNPNPVLSDSDSYSPINNRIYHSGSDEAVGWIAPGAWEGDVINRAGPRAFYFDPQTVTALKLVLRQRNYVKENDLYVYSYGLSNLDLRLDKFLSTGKTIIRFDAPTGTTISNIANVTPEIWNLGGSEHPYVFDYRVIWETAYDSGNYTTTPVPSSQRVWLEITLNESTLGGTPAVTGLNVQYS